MKSKHKVSRTLLFISLGLIAIPILIYGLSSLDPTGWTVIGLFIWIGLPAGVSAFPVALAALVCFIVESSKSSKQLTEPEAKNVKIIKRILFIVFILMLVLIPGYYVVNQFFVLSSQSEFSPEN